MKSLPIGVAFAFALSACTHHAAKPSAPSANVSVVEHAQGRAPQDAPPLYKQAVDEFETGKFADSLRDLDRYIQQNPASPYSQAALLNSGRALEGLKNWNEASGRYRQVIGGTNRAPKLQAMALYRLSVVHEALGDDTQVVADLIDLQSRARFLPQEIAEGEMPARLAAAYARVGNFEKAQYFYQKAEVGIARLRQASKSTPEWLPKTLFLMGETSRSKLSWQDFETFIRPLARSQVYLLEAAELSQDPWSQKAAEELGDIYNQLVETLETAPPPPGEPLIAKRALQQKQWERAALVIECLTDLRARALPEASNAPQVKAITASLKAADQKINALLNERPAGEGLTASAIARRKARQMKTDASNDSLEQAFLKSSRDEKPALVPSPPPAANPMSSTEIPPSAPEPIRAEPAPHKEDPNL